MSEKVCNPLEPEKCQGIQQEYYFMPIRLAKTNKSPEN